MTATNDEMKRQQASRMLELGHLARQRYLEAGGDPTLSVGSFNNNNTLTAEEQQEYLQLSHQVVDDESIANYLKERGSWRDRRFQKISLEN